MASIAAAEAHVGPAGGRILEVGLGTGISLLSYRRSNRIVGIDISAGMLRRAHDSWRGQLVVLGGGAVLLGPLLHWLAADLAWWRAGVALVVGLAIVLLATRCATGRAVTGEWILAASPRAGTQVVIAAAPALLVGICALPLAGLHPVLALTVVPLAFAVVAWVFAPVLVSIAVVAEGDRSWLPARAVRAIHPRWGRATLFALAGAAVISLFALPLVVMGVVLAAVGGWLSLLGSGLAAAAPIPWIACGAVALARALEADQASSLDPSDVAVSDPAWVDGPSWDVVLEPGVPWGTWIRVPARTDLQFRMHAGAGPPPLLDVGREDGTWLSVPIGSDGAAQPVSLATGHAYLQLRGQGAVAERVALAMFVRTAMAA
jgi:hypothetical protein